MATPAAVKSTPAPPLEVPTEAVVSEPTVSENVVVPDVLPSETNTFVAVDEKTALLLKLVVEPMLPISPRMFWYSWFAADTCDEMSVPLAASVESVSRAIEQVGDLRQSAVRRLQHADAGRWHSARTRVRAASLAVRPLATSQAGCVTQRHC